MRKKYTTSTGNEQTSMAKKQAKKPPAAAKPKDPSPISGKSTLSWLVGAVVVPLASVLAMVFLRDSGDTLMPEEASKPPSATPARGRSLLEPTPPGSWMEGFYADPLEGDSPPASHIRLYPNGGGGEPTVVVVDSDDDFLALGRLYNDQGQIVPSRYHFVNNTALYRGPTHPGTHFQWPSVRVGLKRTVPGLFGGTGASVEIETLTIPKDGKEPRVFYVHNFLSPDEAEKLIEYSTSDKNPWKMSPSTAGSHKGWDNGGKDETISTRTSMNAFDVNSETAKRIKKRGFRLLRMGAYQENMADGIQILRYELGQAYVAHHDYFPAYQSQDYNWNPQRGGANRFATIFLYLSDVEYGGQTVFPGMDRLTDETNADLVHRLGEAPTEGMLSSLLEDAHLNENSWEDKLIHTCYQKFAVPPRRGDAILFYSQTPDGMLDPSSLHGACPVLKGTKWGANLWVWNACRYSQCTEDPLHPTEELVDALKAPF